MKNEVNRALVAKKKLNISNRRSRSNSVAVLLLTALCAVCFSSCGVYKKYEAQNQAPENLFGEVPEEMLNEQIKQAAEMSWREFFTDPLLQELIDSALVRNTDLNAARLSIEQAQASLKAAKLAYLPSLSLAPSGGIGGTYGLKTGISGPSYTYGIPLQLDWNIGISGSVTVNKRKANAVLLQAEASREVTQANLISTVAQLYYQLMLLDKELEILLSTDSLWDISLETEKALWENGQAYSTAVNQMESSNLSVKQQIVDAKRSIRSAENSLCKIMAITPQTIRRNSWGEFELPQRFSTGVPSVLLENRPDIKLANHNLEEAFYNTAAARAQFYPSFSLSGLLNWTMEGFTADPAGLLMKLLGTLTQPIFQQGKLRAQLKIAKLSQEQKLGDYVQTVINAGNEVNEALADCQVARDKHALLQRQVEVLQNAYDGTHELMNSGKASYIEVLTAQESLLSAQLNEAENLYNGAIGLISLYIALGGATK